MCRDIFDDDDKRNCTHTTNARLCKGARSKYLHLTNTIWYRRNRQKHIFMLSFLYLSFFCFEIETKNTKLAAALII